ncbi:MAG: phosphopyruvate hydratase, partial [Bdellovibrionales bacterium]|nr:phosphopyruvate hydratase [Bdellovibrionales bacterium]
MPYIENIKAREIIDSRGNPTLEVDLYLSDGSLGRAAVPSGASTGTHEAHELRDGDLSRYHGKGVLSAVNHVQEIILPALKKFPINQLENLDRKLIELDGTENKKKLGANALLGVSLAYAKACAVQGKLPLFQWMREQEEVTTRANIPIPLMNVINGGAHADNGLNVQEFMIIPVCGGRFSEALRAGVEVFHQLKKMIHDLGLSTAVGDEGGFAPKLKSNQQALDLLVTAIEKSHYIPGKDIHIGLDVAASEFYHDDFYHWEGRKITSGDLGEIYQKWSQQYPLVSIEDGFSEDDWSGWIHFTQSMGQKIQLVGDDLFVTNTRRLQQGIDQGAANSILIKVNQIGTLSETRATIQLANENSYHTIMSHRSGETEDTTIADLA